MVEAARMQRANTGGLSFQGAGGRMNQSTRTVSNRTIVRELMMPHPQPNILFVTTDQQRFDTCGPDKPPFMRTPHFDRLCAEGVLFRSGYAACPTCIPARIEMLTGKHTAASRDGVLSRQPAIAADDRTIPMHLRALGYHTSFIGKMHVGKERIRYGFDEVIQPDAYYRWLERSGSPQQPMRHGVGQNELYPTMATVPESLTLTSWIAEQCVEFIRYRRDTSQPFFLWCSFSKPHPPLDPPEPYYSMYRHSAIPAPVYGDWCDDGCPVSMTRWRQMQGYDQVTPEVLREARAAYYGLITQIDYNLGRILSVLTDTGLLRDTLIVYTSDHGEYLGDHRMGAKSFFHEPSAHVPFLLRPPLSWDTGWEGRVDTTAVTHIDILPTLVRAAGGEPPAGGEGMDLIGLLRGDLAAPRCYVDGLSCQNQFWFGDFAPADYLGLTDGRWKYMYYFEGGAEQLFDLATDPQELHNLAGQPAYAVQQAEMRAELIRRHSARGTTAVQDGALVQAPVLEVDPRHARALGWPGYHSDGAPGDIRH
jgi:arylsulfatase A-like enzyme